MKTLVEFEEKYGEVYGSTNISKFLHYLILANNFNSVLELGSGLGFSTISMARALNKIDSGIIHTVDDSRDLDVGIKELLEEESCNCKQEFINKYSKRFNCNTSISYIDSTLDPLKTYSNHLLFSNLLKNSGKKKIDLFFSDFSHGPREIISLFFSVLPLMSSGGSILIDSVPSYLPSNFAISKILDILERGKTPAFIQNQFNQEFKFQCIEFIKNHEFQKSTWLNGETTTKIVHYGSRF